MYSKITGLVCIIAMSAIILSGCGQSKSTNSKTATTNTADGSKLTIVTSFYPMYISTINVTKGIPGIRVINMTKPQTGCLHDYSLKPEDLKTLEIADVFIVNGAGMEAFLDDIVKQQVNLKIVEASKGIELIKDEGGEENPHVWVSISNDIIQVQNIADQLGSMDTANAEMYKANTEAYVKKLEVLKDKMHKVLDRVKNRDIITFHEAFPYFAKEFDLNIAAVVEREPGSEPSPKELEDAIKTVKETGIRALFAEPQYSSKAADGISRETGAKVYILDPVVTGDAGPDSIDAYINTMEQNLKTLQEALK